MCCSAQVLFCHESGRLEPGIMPSARDRVRRQPLVGPQGVINRQHAYSRSRYEEYEALQRGMG